jgi:SHS family lactate transporter-like MFS transporter
MGKVSKYCVTRVTTLKPVFDGAPNPFKLLASLNRRQWMFFLVRLLSPSKPNQTTNLTFPSP